MSPTTDLDLQIAQQLFGCPEAAQAYSTDPAATALVWQWVEARTLISELCFPYHFDGRKSTPRTVRCEIVYRTGRKGTDYGCAKGTGATWPEALCRAALALADALEEETRDG